MLTGDTRYTPKVFYPGKLPAVAFQLMPDDVPDRKSVSGALIRGPDRFARRKSFMICVIR